MKEQIVELILGILTALFGGLNIFQWVTLRSYKRQRAAEADKSEIDALRSIIDTLQDEVARLSKRVEEADERATENSNKYLKLYDDYYALKNEFEQYKIVHK